MTPNATASRQRFSRLMLRWPLSQLLTYVRSRPASSARASWDKPAASRSCRSLLPNRCFTRSACLCITMDAPIVGRMRSASPRTLRHVAQMGNNVLRERAADGDAQNGGGGAPKRQQRGGWPALPQSDSTRPTDEAGWKPRLSFPGAATRSPTRCALIGPSSSLWADSLSGFYLLCFQRAQALKTFPDLTAMLY